MNNAFTLLILTGAFFLICSAWTSHPAYGAQAIHHHPGYHGGGYGYHPGGYYRPYPGPHFYGCRNYRPHPYRVNYPYYRYRPHAYYYYPLPPLPYYPGW
jgi:hypothetical protein